jgi:hypothetical protein
MRTRTILFAPLADRLQQLGLRVWFDEITLTVGDSLRQSIDRGLAKSWFGVVVISPNFLQKDWPQKELNGLAACEINGRKVILPVWHNLGADEIRRYSPMLADRVAAVSSKGLDHVVSQLMEAIHNNKDAGPQIAAGVPRQVASPPQVLQIEAGESGPFFTTTGSGLWDIKRTFNIKLSNVHSHKTATNCKVYVTKIEPQDEFIGPWILTEVTSLPAGDHLFIPLARYGEARDPKKYNCADTFFTTYLHSPGRPALDVGSVYTFILRAVATDSPMYEFRCKLWVDEDGRFRIQAT